MSDFSDAVVDAFRKEARTMIANLDEEDATVLLQSVARLSDLSIQLAAAQTDAQRAKIQQNIEHVKSTLESLKGIAKVKTYRLIMNVVKDVLMTMLKAALFSAIA